MSQWNVRGATLIEMMISLTISSIVMVALLGMTSMHVSFANRGTARAQLSVDMMFLSDYFSREIPSAGGELLPVWSGVIVEDDCNARSFYPDCADSDRLTIVKTTGPNACSIRGSAGNQVLLDNGGGTCCLDSINLARSHVILVRVASIAHRFVTGVDRANCAINVAPGPVAFNDTTPAPTDWTSGMVVPVQIKTFYLTRNTNELVRYTYGDGGNVDDGFNSPIADRILDFQVALGFDFNPADGSIRDTGDHLDEYLFNAPGRVEGIGLGALRDVSLSQLRMVALGLMIGMPVTLANSNSQGGVRLLNGELLPDDNWLLERQVTNYMLRSTRTYQ